jgi:phosphoglycerate dehydrogenase-like enzyme
MVKIFLFGCVVLQAFALAEQRVALVGAGFQSITVNELGRLVHTDWSFIDEHMASDKDLEQAEALISISNRSVSQFEKMPNAKYYQWEYTGITNALVAEIPPKLAVTNCHQSAIPIAEYIIAYVISIALNLNGMDDALRQCTWKPNGNPTGNNCTGARIEHRQLTDGNLTVG